MNISVILCTYNRCGTLAKALDSVAASTFSNSAEWEVVVIDNNSSDTTRDVVEEFCRRYPGRFRYVLEPRQGKSHALNTAVREARGGILAFMDDDVTVEQTWLQNLTAPLFNGEWAGTGGRTFPAEKCSTPRWLAFDGPYGMGGILCAHFDLGDEPRELDRAPYGTNMAFRKTMFEQYGGFRADLGPSNSHEIPRPNEDTEFGRRLMAAGERLRYEPSAMVYHPVPLDRIRKEYLLTWWFDYGRAAVRETGKRPDIFGIPRYYLSIPKELAMTLLVSLRWILAMEPQRRFFLRAQAWYLTGQLVEVYRQSRRKET